jgi:hypothetical protein
LNEKHKKRLIGENSKSLRSRKFTAFVVLQKKISKKKKTMFFQAQNSIRQFPRYDSNPYQIKCNFMEIDKMFQNIPKYCSIHLDIRHEAVVELSMYIFLIFGNTQLN